MDRTKSFYDRSYRLHGFAAQRMYPNEELLRFFGTYYFPLAASDRRRVRVLEAGCGSGANLWMVAREGFEAHGTDLSVEGLALCEEMLARWGTSASLAQGDMTSLRYQDHHFDVVLDVFASYCLPESEFAEFLDEAVRVLKPGGRFFCYTPSKNSDAFRSPGPARWIDGSTLDGILRETSPYFPQDYPFRFIRPDELAEMLVDRGLKVLRNERIGRTYGNEAEYFEFVSAHAEKPASP
jgi:ubiquinone/menaquinone biosynthesis C-methylase UbiE